ncbi:MAG: hypothetical protein QNL20_02640 [Euryarchaeota archaeon]
MMTKAILRASGMKSAAAKIHKTTMVVDHKIGRMLRWLNIAIDQD